MKCRRKLLPAVWTECGGLEPGKVDELVWAPGKRGRGMSRRNFTGSALANEGRNPLRPRGRDCSSDPVKTGLLESE